ncbi:MAG: hypothetical protein E5V74_30365, partial [Mesorhizobium sp.]
MSVIDGAAAPASARQTLQHVVSHMVEAVNRATFVEKPFWHLEMTDIFPADLYQRMRAAMPEAREY